jgi:tetratricopeptide (TPR) repeat protein
MARAAAKGRKRAQQDARSAQRKPTSRRRLHTAEEGLFFSRIRNHAKWAYVLLAVVFAATFAFVGVGTGNSDLTQLFQDIFRGGSGGTSISSAVKKTNENPQNAQAWRELADAYRAKEGHVDDAIAALATYTGLRPKDASGLSELGELQLARAQQRQNEATQARIAEQEAYAPTSFQAPTSSPFGKAFAQDPVFNAVQSQASSVSSDLTSKALTAYGEAVSTYKQLTKLRPNDSAAWLSLDQAAEQGGDITTAVAALKKVAKLEPDQAAQVNARIKALQASGSG